MALAAADPLEYHIEKELLRVLQEESNTHRPRPFRRICDSLVDDDGSRIFGPPGSDLRRRVQKRRYFLLRNPKNLDPLGAAAVGESHDSQSHGKKSSETMTELPKKTREIHSHHFDSTMWNDFSFRDDDIIIATWAKSGTTWMQQIISQMIFNGDTDVNVADISPWVDLRVPPREVKMPAIEAQTHRRFLKTHLPVDALNFSPEAKYVYIARDGRDVVWSLYNHWSTANQAWYDALNGPGLVGDPIPKPPEDVMDFWKQWLEEDGAPFWSFWDNVRTWWAIKDLPNVYLIHFNDLKKDMAGEMRKLAEFLDINIDEEKWPTIVEHCTFDWMKTNATNVVPVGGAFWEGGASTFIHKGTNNRWKDLLTKEDCEKYEKLAGEKLGKECAHWMEHGGKI